MTYKSGAVVIKNSLGETGDREILKTIGRMQRILVYISLGINYSDYIRFREIAGETSFMSDGSYQSYGVKQPLQLNDAEFAVHYSVDTVVQVENQVGTLETPFGEKL